MKSEEYIGKTLAELAAQTSIFGHPIHVFLLMDEQDTTGKLLMDAFSFRQVISVYPAIRNTVVVSASEVCSEKFFRVKRQLYVEETPHYRVGA